MRSSRRCASAGAALALLGALALSPSATAQDEGTTGLVLSPSRVETEAEAGLRVGPFGLRNQTSTRYRVRVLPAQLGQDRSGGVIVRDDAASVRRARQVLRAHPQRFVLAPGEQRSAAGAVKQIPRSGSFYGGLLFEAEPRTDEEQQIVQILRLNASVLLHPPAGQRRVRLATEPIRAEQAGEGEIRLLVPVRNRGNAYLPASGTVRVLDAGGEVRATVELEKTRILPGATVELPGRVRETLPAGTYELRGAVSMAGRSARARGTMTLQGPNEVAFRDAAIAEAPAPDAVRGEPVEIEATYRNSGNVTFAPTAEVVVREVGGSAGGEPLGTHQIDASEAQPGEHGEISGQVELPAEPGTYELELRLLDGERSLDSRSVTVTPQAGLGFFAGVEEWLTDNAIALLALLALLVLALATWGALQIRRLRAAAAGGDGATRRGAGAASGERADSEPRRQPPGGWPRSAQWLDRVRRSQPSAPEPTPTAEDQTAGTQPSSRVAAGGSKPVREPAREPVREPVAVGRNGHISLRNAGFEELRAVGLSTTQARRVLRYRDERGVDSVERLDEVPGLPAATLAELRQRLVD